MDKIGILQDGVSPCEVCGAESVAVEEGAALCARHCGGGGSSKTACRGAERVSRAGMLEEAGGLLGSQKETDK